jgi:hypothetical protein
MDRTICEGFETLRDIPGQLRTVESICNGDPVTIWEEDGAKIRMLERTIESMKRCNQPGAERLEAIRDVLKWKRCDIGRWLLQSTPAGGGQSIWSEMIEVSKHKARA